MNYYYIEFCNDWTSLKILISGSNQIFYFFLCDSNYALNQLRLLEGKIAYFVRYPSEERNRSSLHALKRKYAAQATLKFGDLSFA